jgi:hypothetical protein
MCLLPLLVPPITQGQVRAHLACAIRPGRPGADGAVHRSSHNSVFRTDRSAQGRAGASVRHRQSIDSMVVVYMIIALIWLVSASRFVNPTRIVTSATR